MAQDALPAVRAILTPAPYTRATPVHAVQTNRKQVSSRKIGPLTTRMMNSLLKPGATNPFSSSHLAYYFAPCSRGFRIPCFLIEQVREAAASALGELGSADEITKHSMCAALSASSKSVVTEAAAALGRLFPPGKWSDGLDSLDLDLVGTLALLG
jgi:HEAT repeat protein